MSALASDHFEQTRVRSARGKAAGLSGIAFALAYLIGSASLNAPLRGSDQKIVEFWSDGGNQTAAVISMYCFAIAGLLFLVFMSNLRARLAERDTGSSKLSEIVFGSGLVFVVMLFVSGVARGVIGFGTKSHWSQPVPDADLLRYLPQISYAAGGLALLAAADELDRIPGLDALREHEHCRLRISASNLHRGPGPLVLVGGRHAHIDDRHLRLMLCDDREQRFGVADSRNDLMPGILEQAGEPFA